MYNAYMALSAFCPVRAALAAVSAAAGLGLAGVPRPVSLLRLSLQRLLDSNFPGNSPWAWEFHPLRLRFCWNQTLCNPES